MIAFPNCKINLGLHITAKRTDGYHDLETIFYPINLKEAVEIIPFENFKFNFSGLTVDGSINDNLCVKAYYLLKKDFPFLPDINMWLHKRIPMGAGLGGGSADGAFTLKLINEKFQLNLSTAQLLSFASKLGSDCPFFILNKPCFASGRGEILEPVQVDLSQYSFVVVNPGIHINTSWAFAEIEAKPSLQSLKEIIGQPVKFWKHGLKNDFEQPVLKKYPQLREVKEKLYLAGALYASMTGSGSVFYGIFEKSKLPSTEIFSNYVTTTV